MGKLKARMAIYALAGVYLLYMAWNMIKGLETAGTEKMVMIIFIALFAIVGLGLVLGGIYFTFKDNREKQSGSAGESEKRE